MTHGWHGRIVLIASSYHPHVGGVEEHVRHVAGRLREMGFDVEVWTVDRGEHLGRQQVDGIPVLYLPTPLPARDLGALGRLARRAPSAAAAWWRAFRAFRPDVLHVHCFGPNGVYALALGGLTRTPLIVTSHGETFADDHAVFQQSALLRMALRRSLARAEAVTAPTTFVLDSLRSDFGPVTGQVVPNGVDLDQPVGPTPAAPEGSLVFSVGRLERMKGFDLLLDAVALLDGVQVVLGGDGAERSNLDAQVERRGLAGRVLFTGRLSSPEVAAWMRRADVVAVPSRREAFGIVALEAWRAGTPVVVTRHGGMTEFVTDGVDGLVVDPLDTGALADAVDRLLKDGPLSERLAHAGTSRVREYAWSAVAERYARVYAEVGQATRGG